MNDVIKLVIAAVVGIAPICGAWAEKGEAGPRGGKLLENDPPRAEVVVEPDATLSIAFYDAGGSRVAPTDQTVTAVAEAPSGRAKLEFQRKGDVLVSTAALPKGEGYPVVIQVKRGPAEKPQNFRFPYTMDICGGCQRPEYACTCDE